MRVDLLKDRWFADALCFHVATMSLVSMAESAERHQASPWLALFFILAGACLAWHACRAIWFTNVVRRCGVEEAVAPSAGLGGLIKVVGRVEIVGRFTDIRSAFAQSSSKAGER